MKIALLILAAALGAAPSFAQDAATAGRAPSAREIVDRIKAHVGIPWMSETRDTFKAGDPETPVTGIAVTMMATMKVLERAAARGQNLIITHEPTFYDDPDRAETVPDGDRDPVLKEKRAFIEKHHLVIWRFHDHQHRMQLDQVEQGNARKLGWERYRDPGNQYLFTLPETTVGKLAGEMKEKLGASAIRIVGDHSMKVTRVGFSPGSGGAEKEIAALEIPELQVLVVGETREWETVEYVADAVTEGRQKALIILSHVPSEQSGAEQCVQWLETFLTGIPIEFVATPDPFQDGALLAEP
ncbi:MAG TPA: Nif3-like dinuclear metal center hexameric protein [Candidatus Acidoferrum sp.]|nr:Nif3-like dinuclear metal center hexameric protein [Candidatus Acidoferrum sp.]